MRIYSYPYIGKYGKYKKTERNHGLEALFYLV